ncbi:hypothetical protein [Marinitoga litoralis]|uniref:hypothetical protein n=1 Tax=Marinitoga litoralis TaxID=570855 RepID=UPI00195FBEF7|nr:hypothetical protein [Marinitoga litoralis]MBM7559341.1 hypothetical protein [Marinitoga litoralis]
MKYYICELVDNNNESIKIALEDKIIGVSSEFIKKNIEGNFLGYVKFKDHLYPALTLPDKKEFILKIFLIYKSFAFGVTNIIKNEKIDKIEKFNKETLELFPHLKIFSGYFEYNNEEIFIFNIDKVYDEIPENIVVKTPIKKKEEKEHVIKPNAYVIDNKISILKNNIISIIDTSGFCPFKSDEYDGFVEYKNKIYNVKKTSDNPKWIVISKKMALLSEKIEFEYGEIFDSEDKKVLKFKDKTLPILE